MQYKRPEYTAQLRIKESHLLEPYIEYVFYEGQNLPLTKSAFCRIVMNTKYSDK